jgi:Antitoxin-like ribbon-helix-helix
MARKPSLSEAVTARDHGLEQPPPAQPPKATPAGRGRAASRVGRKGVAFWVDPDAGRQLRIMAAEEDRTTQSLMEEALDLLFQKRGRYRLAVPPG